MQALPFLGFLVIVWSGDVWPRIHKGIIYIYIFIVWVCVIIYNLAHQRYWLQKLHKPWGPPLVSGQDTCRADQLSDEWGTYSEAVSDPSCNLCVPGKVQRCSNAWLIALLKADSQLQKAGP